MSRKSQQPGALGLAWLKLRWMSLSHAWNRALWGLTALVTLASLAMGAWLGGAFVPRWIDVANVNEALPQENWPAMDTALRTSFFAEGGLQDALRRNLGVVNQNKVRAETGIAIQSIAESPERSVKSEQDRAQWQWVDSHACTLSDWKGGDMARIAVLVRNGLWGCSGFKRTLAGLPLVIWYGTYPGLILSVMLVMLAGLLIAWLVRAARHHGADTRTHHEHFLSRLAD